MVNFGPTDPPVDPLAEVRDRALRSTEVSFVITDAARAGSPIVWVNDAFCRTTGYTLDEVVGRDPNLLHGPATDRTQTRLLADAVRAETVATVVVRNYRKDGTSFWNQVTVSPVRDDAGVVTHWVGVQVDVTAQVELADAQQASIDVERRARAGLALVAQVSDLLADLENPLVLREIAALLEPSVVRRAAFFMDDGGLRPADGIASVVHERGSRDGGGHRLPRSEPDEVRSSDPVQEVLDGHLDGPIELDLAAPAAGTTTEHLVALLRGRGEPADGTVVVHAVPGRRRTLGLLVTTPHGTGGLHRLDEHDLTLMHLVVRRVGMAVDNVRLYAREHRLAETLQRSMLPEQGEVRDLDVWSYYAPSSGHAQVGGDWFDVVQVEPDLVALVIGDVVGHDVEAAASMGQLRSVVRSFIHDAVEPGSVLDRVDQLVAGMRVPRSASLVLASLERTPTGWRMSYSRAGHLPPVVARGSQVVQLTGASGGMVGFGDARRSTAHHDLRPGDLLVLYTDGLVERRDRNLRDGVAALLEAAAELGAQDAAGVGEELLSRLAGDPEDDIAVVVVRVPDPDADLQEAPTPRRRRWALPSEPGSIARARHAVVRTCVTWDIPGAQAAELVVSEMVANAVMHGWGHVVLRLFDTGEGLRIEVEDSNPAPPVTTDGHPGRVGGFGMRIVERLADWGWRPAGTGKLVWARVRPQSIPQVLAGRGTADLQQD